MNSNKLLEEVKTFLNYTWEDKKRDTRLVMYINSSIDYLQEVAYDEIDFEQDHLAHDLLLNRVLYMNSQALDDFQTNYSGLLNELRIKYNNYDNED